MRHRKVFVVEIYIFFFRQIVNFETCERLDWYLLDWWGPLGQVPIRVWMDFCLG